MGYQEVVILSRASDGGSADPSWKIVTTETHSLEGIARGPERASCEAGCLLVSHVGTVRGKF